VVAIVLGTAAAMGAVTEMVGGRAAGCAFAARLVAAARRGGPPVGAGLDAVAPAYASQAGASSDPYVTF